MSLFRIAFAIIILFSSLQGISQETDIFQLMERRDLKLSQIEALANNYFSRVGKGKGTGYKQYQRWLYETKFHLDDKGYILSPDQEWNQYLKVAPKMTKLSDISGIWQEMGPKSWNRTSGWNPGVGRLTSVAVDLSNNNRIFVSSPGGGIWRTLNGGGTWTCLTDQNSSWMTVNHIAIDPSSPGIVYASLSSGGVIKSYDGGDTWGATGSGPNVAYKVLIQPDNTSNIFVATSTGIYRSTNGGVTYSQVHSSTKQDIEFQPGNSSVIYASGPGSSTVNSFWRSSDNGITWTGVGATEGINSFGRSMIAVSPQNPSIVYMVQATGNVFGAFYRSTDGGQNFIKTLSGGSCNNFFGYETSGCGTTGQANYDMAITADPDNASEVHIAGIICWKSINGGNSFAATTAWSLPNSLGYNHADVHGLEYINGKIYSVSDGGLYVSPDKGDNWTDLSTGLGIRQFYKIASSKTNPNMFSGGAQDNGSSIKKTNGWIDWLGADGMDCLISPLDSNLQWGTSQNGSFYRTTNGGNSNTGLAKPSDGNWVTPLDIESNSNVIYGGWTGVYKSTNNGTSWTLLSGSTITEALDVLELAPSNPNYIYAARGNTLYVTTNGGTSWNVYLYPSLISDIAVSPSDPAKVYFACASSSNRVLLSLNSGQTWTNFSTNLPAISARTIVIDEKPEEGIYVGMNIGVYYRDNTMSGWADRSGNLPRVAIRDINLQGPAGKLRVGTYGRGVWETELAVTCGNISNLNVSGLTQVAANLSWSAVPGANSYTLEYKTSTSINYTVITGITSTAYSLVNLLPGKDYEWKVTVVCDAGTGNPSSSSFQTLFYCTPPQDLITSNITWFGSVLTWLPVVGAADYDVDYRVVGSSSWTNAYTAIDQSAVILNGLSGSTDYEWRVRANCNSSGSSTYSTANFTTAMPPCPDAYEPNNTYKTSSSLAVNTPITAKLNSFDDVDWFKIPIGNSNQTKLRVTLSNLPADYDIYLYDKTNTLRAQANTTGTGNDIIIYNSNSKNTFYYVKVQNKAGAYNDFICYNLIAETSNINWQTVPGMQVTTFNSNLVLFPQPARTTVTIAYDDTEEGMAEMRILDMSGRLCLLQEMEVMRGRNLYDVDISRFAKGVYTLQWFIHNKTTTIKLVVQ